MSKILTVIIAALFSTTVFAAKHMAAEAPKAEAKQEMKAEGMAGMEAKKEAKPKKAKKAKKVKKEAAAGMSGMSGMEAKK